MRKIRDLLHSALIINRPHTRWLGVAAFLASTGCGESLPDGIVDIASVPFLTVVEERRIGSVDDPDVGFSDIGAVAVDAEGLTYVLERGDRTVRVYDEPGALVRTIGRSGEGPGEFVRPLAMGLLGDTLWVNDFGLRRLTFFSRSGNVIRIAAPQPTSLSTTNGLLVQLTPAMPRSDGLITSGWMVPVLRNSPTDSFLVPIVRMDSAGSIVDTLRLQPWALRQQNFVTFAGREIPLPAGPTDGPLFVDTEDGAYAIRRSTAVIDDPAMFGVSKIVGMADTVFYREYLYKPKVLDRLAIQSILRPWAARFLGPSDDTAGLESTLERAMLWPSYLPPVSEGRTGQDSTLWLRREDSGGPTSGWLLIAPTGSAIGQLELDRNSRVMWSSGNRLWVVARDEFDVPWLIRYRLENRD